MWEGGYSDVTEMLFGRSMERQYIFPSLLILSHSAALCSPILVSAIQKESKEDIAY